VSGHRVTPAGQARKGDLIVTPSGERLEIVSVIGAHELIAGISEQDRRLKTPNFWRDSMAGQCVLNGHTTGRERRDRERRLAKLAKQREQICSTRS
jgi:hypothetical protein